MLVYLGRTKQPLQSRLRGHVFGAPLHRKLDIFKISKIEYAEFKTEADMFLYEIYFINLYKPLLNNDDKAKDYLTLSLPEPSWKPYIPPMFNKWIEKINQDDADFQAKQELKEQLSLEIRKARRKKISGEMSEDEFYQLKEKYEKLIKSN